MDPKLVKMTVGCGISHTIIKTHIQFPDKKDAIPEITFIMIHH
jgi:hypothetical protein